LKNISPEICRKIAQARRDANISQSSLALEIGCKQPAISMFESGDGTKLSEEMVKKLAAKFGISLEPPSAVSGISVIGGMDSVNPMDNSLAFCPNCHCPSNVPYVVDGRLFLRPSNRIASPVADGKRCTVCGEVLERRCPGCGAPLNEGACCAVCGMRYVTPALPAGTDIFAWAQARREEIDRLRTLS